MKFYKFWLLIGILIISSCNNLSFTTGSSSSLLKDENIIKPSRINIQEHNRNVDVFTPLAKEFDSTIPKDDFCYNILPLNICEEYNLDAFKFSKSNKIYFYYKDKISDIGDIYYEGSDEIITDIVIADVNNDYYIEIYIAYQFGNNITMSKIVCFDTYSNYAKQSSTCYNNLLFFKIENNNINAYKTIYNNPDKATTLFSEIKPRNIYLQFSNDEYDLTNNLLDVSIKFDLIEANFPIEFIGNYKLFANIHTLYKGEEFSYMGSSTTYGAIPKFIKSDDQNTMLGPSLYYDEDYTLVTILTNSTYDDNFYYILEDNLTEGSYQMVVEFNNELITINNALTINYR